MTGEDWFPILLSLRVAALSLLLVGPPGILLALLQARRDWWGRTAVDALVMLPLVLPPSVIGYFLVLMLGRNGALAPVLDTLGWRVIFTPTAAVLASALVALPILVKTAQPALASVPSELVDVGRSLGLGPIAVFFRVILPYAWPGVLAALVLALARAIGEFGATLMFAGNIPGRTNTMPVEIFSAYQAGEDDRALVYVAVLTALSTVVVLIASRLGPAPRST